MSDRNLVMRILLQAQDKASAALDRIRQSGTGLAAQLTKSQQAVRELERTLKGADRFADYQQKIKAAEAETHRHAAAIKKLAAEIKAAGKPTQKQVREMERLEKASQAAAAKETKLKDESAKLARELKKAGFDTRNFANAQIAAKAKIGQHTAQIDRQTAALERVARARKNYDSAQRLSGNLQGAAVKTGVAGAAITGGVGVTLRASMGEEDAMLDIVKQVGELKNADNSLNHGNVAKMRAEIQALSRELPLSTIEIMQLYAAGARMDVPRKELEGYARTAAQAATAFDALDVGAMAENLGRISKNFKLSAEEGRKLADVINYLDDNSIAKGEGIINFMNRVSGSMGLAKISEKDTAALGSTLMTAGIEDTQAAGAVSSLFTRLSTAPDMKPVRKAIQAIGMDATAVQKGMVEDAQKTVMTIIEAVKKMPKEEQAGLLKGLAGGEYNKVFAGLISNTEEWRRQIELANSQEALGSMGREFETRMSSMSAKWQVFKNQLFNSSATGGGTLHKSLGDLLDQGTKMLDMFNKWAQKNPKTAEAIMKTVAVLGVLLLAISGISAAIAAVILPMAALKFGLATLSAGGTIGNLGALSKVFDVLKIGITAVGRAAMANPLVLIIGAIVFGLYMLWKHWDTVKNALIRGWQWIDNVFRENPILNFVFPIIGAARAIINNWDMIGPFFSSLWNKVKTAVLDAMLKIWAKVTSVLAAIKDYLKNIPIVNYFIEKWSAVIAYLSGLKDKLLSIGRDVVQNLINGIKEKLKPLQDLWHGVTRIFDGVNKTASSTPVSPARGYSAGGYTGGGGKNEAAGIVHRGEVVFSQDDVKRFGGWRLVDKLRKAGASALQRGKDLFTGGSHEVARGKGVLNGMLGLGSDSLKQQAGTLFDKARAVLKNPLAEGGVFDKTLRALLPMDDNSQGMAFALPGAISAPEALRQAAGMKSIQQAPAVSRSAAGGSNYYYINVTVPAGSNGRQIGNEVMAAIEQHDAAQRRRSRGGYQDKD